MKVLACLRSRPYQAHTQPLNNIPKKPWPISGLPGNAMGERDQAQEQVKKKEKALEAKDQVIEAKDHQLQAMNQKIQELMRQVQNLKAED